MSPGLSLGSPRPRLEDLRRTSRSGRRRTRRRPRRRWTAPAGPAPSQAVGDSHGGGDGEVADVLVGRPGERALVDAHELVVAAEDQLPIGVVGASGRIPGKALDRGRGEVLAEDVAERLAHTVGRTPR